MLGVNIYDQCRKGISCISTVVYGRKGFCYEQGSLPNEINLILTAIPYIKSFRTVPTNPNSILKEARNKLNV